MSTSQGPQDFPPANPLPGQPNQSQTPPPKEAGGNWLKTCLLVGFGGFLLVLLSCGIGGCYLYQNMASIATDATRNVMVTLVEESDLSQEDKAAIVVEIDRVAEAYKSGDITLEQVGSVMEELAQSPLLTLGMVFAAEENYLKPSGLSDEEKEKARITLQRVARGVFEETIQRESLETAMNLISEEDFNGQQQIKQQLSDDELKEFLAECKKVADEAEVPDESFEVNIGAEFKKAVDKALGK